MMKTDNRAEKRLKMKIKHTRTRKASIIDTVRKAETLRDMVEDKLLSIIKDIEDPYITDVLRFSTSPSDSMVQVEYEFRFRNVRDTACTSVPAEYLEDGFDYHAAALSKTDEPESPAKAEAVSLMRKELDELARLKAKYEV